MLRKTLFFCFVLSIFVSGLVVRPAAAQETGEGIVCDDATYMLLLLAEIRGYSSNESTLFEPVDLSQFDLGENQPYFDAILPALTDDDMTPLTDEIVMELLPVVEELGAGTEALTQTDQGDIVGEDPACKELRSSVTDYLSGVLLYEYVLEVGE